MSNNQRVNLVCLDVDAVLAPCKPKACKLFGIPCEVDNFPSDELVYELAGGKKLFWDKVGTHSFFANLGVYDWAHDLVNMVNGTGIDWIFLTKSSINHGVASGKCEWLEKNFSKKFRDKLWINKGTKSYMSGPNRWLIDDKETPNGEEWRAAGGSFYHWAELHPSETIEAARRIEKLKLILTEGK